MPDQPLTGVRILLVDDHDDTRELFEFALTREGAEVRLATSADDARSILATWTPTVIVSDLTMPGEDGFSLIRSIRTNDATRRIPAVAFTAHAEEVARVRVLQSGFQAHLAKPVDIPDFIRAVARLSAPQGTCTSAKPTHA